MTRQYPLSAILCVSALCLPAAAGELQLQVGPNFGAGVVDAAAAPGSGEHFFDLPFTESGPPYDEQLYAYDLFFRAPRPGLTLLRAEKPDNWVLNGTDASFTVADAAPDHLLVNVGTQTGPLTDITTGTKAARIYYSVDPGAAPGLYNITLDPSFTGFAGGERIGADPSFPVGLTDPGVVRVTPEPSGLALLGAASVLALRRRVRGEA